MLMVKIVLLYRYRHSHAADKLGGWMDILRNFVVMCRMYDSGTDVISFSMEVVVTMVTIPCNDRGNTVPLLWSFVQQVCTALH